METTSKDWMIFKIFQKLQGADLVIFEILLYNLLVSTYKEIEIKLNWLQSGVAISLKNILF